MFEIRIFVILFVLSILPLIRSNLSGLYLLQLKEYRRDRIKDFLRTKEGKHYLLNKQFFIYLGLFCLVVTSFVLFRISGSPGWLINTHITLGYILWAIYFVAGLVLGIDALYFIYKVVKKNIKLPKKTFRSTLVLSGTFLLQIILFFLDYTYSFGGALLVSNIIISSLLLLVCSTCVAPIINYQKKQTYRQASLKIAKYKELIGVGITGSYGKSSVKTLLNELLSAEFNTICTPENINTEMGVSNLILKSNFENKDYFVCEMGAYKQGEIRTLGEIANHKHGFLTGIGNQHIGLFGSQENIRKGKFEILESVIKNDGKLYINGEGVHEDKPIKNIVKYGFKNSFDAYATIEKVNTEGQFSTLFQLNYRDKKYDVTTNLIGDHNILNLTGVLAFLVDQGVDLYSDKIKKALLHLSKPKSTLDIKEKDGILFIDDTYNLSVDGLWAGIDFLKYFTGPKVLVLDDIIELGKESESIHFAIGKKLAYCDFANIYLVGKSYSNFIAKGYHAGSGKKDIVKIGATDLQTGRLAGLKTILFEGRESKKILDKVLTK